jgi:tripartite-type tricarboxylate transporter receptor subunit TctC
MKIFNSCPRTSAVITFVPFTGYTPAVQALLAHQVTVAQADLTTLQGQLQMETVENDP